VSDIARAFAAAFALLRDLDPELIGIVVLSLRVSLSATAIAMVLAAPLGALLAVSHFAGRQTVIVLTNALLGLPPVVVGLAGYVVLSRSGPLGFAGLLFTPAAMIIAQVMLTIPIVIALVHRAAAGLWAD
jgi:tungstate transport system permease protein